MDSTLALRQDLSNVSVGRRKRSATLAPWQTYRENTVTFLDRQKALRELYDQQQDTGSKETTKRWTAVDESTILPSARLNALNFGSKKTSTNNTPHAPSPRVLVDGNGNHPNNQRNDATVRSAQAPTVPSSYSNVALLPISPRQKTANEVPFEWTKGRTMSNSPRNATQLLDHSVTEWSAEMNKHMCQRETHRNQTELSSQSSTLQRPMRQPTLLDMPLATSPRRGMLEITVPQLSRDRMLKLGSERNSSLTLFFRPDRSTVRDVPRPIRFSDLDESLTIGDVGLAATNYCDRKMKYITRNGNDLNLPQSTHSNLHAK